MAISSKYSISKAVEIIKTGIFKILQAKFDLLDKVYGDNDGIDVKDYFISLVVINIKIIKERIRL